MITDIPGFRLGHATDHDHHTGCTVILPPSDTVGGVDVRGLAPASREIPLLSPDKKILEVHAILLTGGSAFGLAAADGVMRYFEEQEIGYWTPLARVPIVPSAAVYDLFLGRGAFRPDADMGYLACENASTGAVEQGNVGAGAGVTVGKWGGFEGMMKGGFGSASLSLPTGLEAGGAPTLLVAAAAVVNSVGDVVDQDGSVLAGARDPQSGWLVERHPLRLPPNPPPSPPGTNTTLVVVGTNARLSKAEVNWLAQRAHDGLAIAIRPAHTFHDGDTCFVLASGQVEANYNFVANATVEVVAEAIRNAVRHAASVAGVPGLGR